MAQSWTPHSESMPLEKPPEKLPEDHTELRQRTTRSRRATRRQRCDPGFLVSGAASQEGAIPPVPVQQEQQDLCR